MTTSTSPDYRADIDGLRALAILAVFIYHSFPALCPSGYTGVDVFFVISGYLITGILAKKKRLGAVELAAFYEGRVRRLFPALIIVLSATLVAAWFLLLPLELSDFGQHLRAGATFTSNFELWHEAGYFDAMAELKPLRMLWSLGVEEQFYIIWPFLIIVVWWRGARLETAIWVIAGLSFAVCLGSTQTDDPGAFFSPICRFWELAVGAGLVLHNRSLFAAKQREKGSRWSLTTDARAWAGIAILFSGFFLIPVSARFPGAWALIPVVGTALVLQAGPRSNVSKHLASAPLVFIGLISYPLYLWHWPLLSLPRIVLGSTPPASIRACAVAISVLLAYLTYRFVEKPIRMHRSRTQTGVLVSAIVLLGITGYLCVRNAGFPDRAANRQTDYVAGLIAAPALQEYFAAAESEYFPCTPSALFATSAKWGKHVRCFQSKSGVPIDIAIVGDSHAEHLFIGLARNLPQKNVVMYMQESVPYIGDPWFKLIFEEVLKQPNIKQVIVSAYWSNRAPAIREQLDFKAVMQRTIAQLAGAGKVVYLTNDTPTFSFDASHCKYRRPLNRSETCLEDRSFFTALQNEYMPEFESIVSQTPGSHLMDLSQFFCDQQVCRMAVNGVILFRDREHLSVPGSIYLGQNIVHAYPELLE